MTDYHITVGCKQAIDLYIELGIPPGRFLTAVICNDLMSAISHADIANKKLISEYVRYFYNEAPGNCWGSTEAMQSWMEKFK